ncbi:MAG: glycosyltransferase [Chitinophagaceae bacterium]|nr:MAG: glycosyltransferase [Chitinophagaceae bacterium]
MADKKTIIHVIYNLARGGAETMLINVLPELSEYRNIVVTLSGENHFGDALKCDQLICLKGSSLFTIPASVHKLKKLIRQLRPALIHSHLPLSNFVARLATPKAIPLITTIHTPVSAAVDYKKWYVRTLERCTYSFRPSTIIAVSQQVLKDYFDFLQTNRKRALIIYTFPPTSLVMTEKAGPTSERTKILTVGSLREIKNFAYLIEAFGFLKNENIELHIYGRGSEMANLQAMIDRLQVNVVLKGQVNNIPEVMGQYDLFTMASKFEGFSVSVLEAMNAKLPMLLSDIPSFREQCENCALYFSLNDPADFANKLKNLIADQHKMKSLTILAYTRLMHNFTLAHHVQQIKDLYAKELVGEKIP